MPNVKKSGTLTYPDLLGPSWRPVVGETFTFTLHFFNVVFFSSHFPTKTLYAALVPHLLATGTFHLILLYLSSHPVFGKEYNSCSFSLSNFFHSPVTYFLLGPNIFLANYYPIYPNVRDQVSHPYKTTWRIIVWRILIFILLDSKLEDKTFCTGW